MRRAPSLVWCLIALAVPTASRADAITAHVEDSYVGAWPNYSGWWGDDQIGSHFGIASLDATFDAGVLTVTVYGGYFDHVGEENTSLGDLFISTDGWSPGGAEYVAGEGPWPEDRSPYSTTSKGAAGEDWEYVAYLSSKSSTSGVVGLYAVDGSRVLHSSAPPNYVYREHQEVAYDPGPGDVAIATGAWSLTDTGGPDSHLTISVDLSAALLPGEKEIGLHWAMSCANDVIEGSLTIPEPASLCLAFSSFAGVSLLVARRRRGRRWPRTGRPATDQPSGGGA